MKEGIRFEKPKTNEQQVKRANSTIMLFLAGALAMHAPSEGSKNHIELAQTKGPSTMATFQNPTTPALGPSDGAYSLQGSGYESSYIDKDSGGKNDENYTYAEASVGGSDSYETSESALNAVEGLNLELQEAHLQATPEQIAVVKSAVDNYVAEHSVTSTIAEGPAAISGSLHDLWNAAISKPDINPLALGLLLKELSQRTQNIAPTTTLVSDESLVENQVQQAVRSAKEQFEDTGKGFSSIDSSDQNQQ